MIDDRTLPSIVCKFCSRLRSTEARNCDAFPDGIPDIIWNGENQHQDTFLGDHGLQFNWIDQP